MYRDIAQQDVPVLNAVDEATRRIFQSAVADHEKHSRKKWRNMTPYERSKVLETFLRLQRDEREARKIMDAKDPQRIQQDLSMCISVGEIKPGPNPHVKLAEKRLGPAHGAMRQTGVRFDGATLRDPKKIVKQVVSLKTQATREDAEELSSQRDEMIHEEFKDDIPPQLANLSESQMLEELQRVRDAKQHLLNANSGIFKQADSQFSVSPQKSVLHLRYPYKSDQSVVDSNMQSNPKLLPVNMSPMELHAAQSPDLVSTAMRLDSDAQVAGAERQPVAKNADTSSPAPGLSPRQTVDRAI